MTSLGPQQQNLSYNDLLQIPGGVTGQLQQVQDGSGNITGLWLSSVGSNVLNSIVEEQVITASAGQTVFNLSFSYEPLMNTLQVYVDGLNQIVDIDYLETNATTVTFLSPLSAGQLVKFTTALGSVSTTVNASNITMVGANGTVGVVQDMADPTGSDFVGFKQAGTGAVNQTAQDKMRKIVSVFDFGAVGDGVTDDSAAIQAAVNYVFSVPTPAVWLNSVPDYGNIVLDFGGKEFLLENSIIFPIAGGGGVTFQNGRLLAGATFDPARYLVEANTSNIAFQFITIQNMVFDGAHIAGCLRLYKYHNMTITNCFFIHYGTIGILAEIAGDSLNINSCYFYEYLYGETGFDVNGTLKARCLHLGNADSSILNCVFGFGKEGIYIDAGLNRIQQCHFYGLNNWCISQTNNASNIWITDNYFDAPTNANTNAQVFIANPYEVVLTGNKFNYLVANGTCVSVFPTAAGKAFSGFFAKNNRFSIGAYTPSGTLTLSSAAYGNQTITFSASYANQNMIGSVIKEKNSGSGVAVIVNYTNATTVSVQIQKPFSGTGISAGNWDHIPNSIFVDERNYTIGTTVTNSAVKDNFFAGAQPRYTDVTIKQIMDGVSTSGEVSIGHVLLVQNSIDNVVLTYVEGASATVYTLKPYYYPASRSVVAWASNAAIPSPAPMYVKCYCSVDQT